MRINVKRDGQAWAFDVYMNTNGLSVHLCGYSGPEGHWQWNGITSLDSTAVPRPTWIHDAVGDTIAENTHVRLY